MSKEELLNMRIHDIILISDGWAVMKVIDGWIYYRNSEMSTFVPDNRD